MNASKPLLLVFAVTVLSIGCSAAPGSRVGTTAAASSAESAPCTRITQSGESIVDGSGNVWTLGGPSSDQVIYENGSLAGYSANVTQLLYVGGVVSQENAAGGWWAWTNGGWNGESDPSGSCTESASCTALTQPGASIIDGSGNTWSLQTSASSGLVIAMNGALAGYSANVAQLVYVGGVVSQENHAGGWWDWSNGSWNGESDPTGPCSGSGSSSGSGSGSGSSSGGSGSSSGGGGTGWFSVANGQILTPNGTPFVAKGVDVDVSVPPSQVLALFPGLNFVRLPTANWPSAADLQAEVTGFTNAGVVVEIEDHPWPEVAPYTGSDLDGETSWYASLASAFMGNPYVWFGSMNEPQTSYGAGEAAISTQEAAIYGAIRGTGSNTIIMMELMGGGNPGTVGAGFGMTPSTYASMTSIVWDFHFYGWDSGYGTDQATVNAALAGSASAGDGIAAAQTITSADGIVPVLIGEYGDSTDGQNVDPNWTQVLAAVQASGYGSSAWEVSPGGVADVLVSGGALTPYGLEVAQYIAQ
jgi:hypothetical protein